MREEEKPGDCKVHTKQMIIFFSFLNSIIRVVGVRGIKKPLYLAAI